MSQMLVDDKLVKVLLEVTDLSAERISLKPGELLVLKVRAAATHSPEPLMELHKIFQSLFPNNKVILLRMDDNFEIKFESIGALADVKVNEGEAVP